jgi:hypothetical protein
MPRQWTQWSISTLFSSSTTMPFLQTGQSIYIFYFVKNIRLKTCGFQPFPYKIFTTLLFYLKTLTDHLADGTD